MAMVLVSMVGEVGCAAGCVRVVVPSLPPLANEVFKPRGVDLGGILSPMLSKPLLSQSPLPTPGATVERMLKEEERNNELQFKNESVTEN